jgi:hypothetical protein
MRINSSPVVSRDESAAGFSNSVIRANISPVASGGPSAPGAIRESGIGCAPGDAFCEGILESIFVGGKTCVAGCETPGAVNISGDVRGLLSNVAPSRRNPDGPLRNNEFGFFNASSTCLIMSFGERGSCGSGSISKSTRTLLATRGVLYY